MSHHKLFPPSGAHRWMQCTASIDIVNALPDSSSEFSREGVAAHAAFAHILTYGHLDLGSPLPEGYTYTREMRDALQPAVMKAMQLINSAPHNVEQSVNFQVDKDTIFGTADLLVLDGDVLRVVDLKYGQGVRVYAKDNEQLMLYALAAIESFGWWGSFKTIELHILQPRLDHYDSHKLKRAELYAWSAHVESAVRAYRSGAVSFKPGEKQCRWCPHASNCAAATANVVSLFEDLHEVADDTPSIDITDLLDRAPLVEHLIKKLREEAQRRLQAGKEVPGYKLVEGRTQRRWMRTKTAIVSRTLQDLDEPPYKEPELRSVADIEKSVPKHVFENRFKEFVHKPEGRPTLAKESDKRPAITSIQDAFENLN